MKGLRPRGTCVGPYVVGEPIGRGAMGAVYRAVHRETGGAAALKLLHDATPAGRVRFEREARYLTLLHHPHIVRCLESGSSEGGEPWIAMELLEGVDLAARLRAGPLALDETLALARQLCAALAHAHDRERPLLHRDLKPSNIFLCGASPHRARVLDFGLARMVGDARLTRGEHAVGTIAYASPEQLNRDVDLDHRSDLWSLGAVLYECHLGRSPFDGWGGVPHDEDVAAALTDAGAPAPFAAVVYRLLRRARAARFESARAVGEALDGVEGGAAAPHGSRARQAPEAARCVVVVCLLGVRQAHLIERTASAFDGVVVDPAEARTLVVFGVDRWRGDEPRRATRMALALAPAAASIGVALGASHAAGGDAVVRAAESVATRAGVTVDASIASLVRADFPVTPAEAGAWRVAPQPRQASPAEAAPSDGPLVGRSTELQVLLRSVERADEEGRPAVVHIRGGLGMGKTRLRAEATARALERRPSIEVVEVRCDTVLRRTPFAALREALAGWVDPGLLTALAPTEPAASPEAALGAAREAIEVCLLHLARRGLVLVAIDDAHWLDEPTRRVLRALCAEGGALPLAVWLFERDDDEGALERLGDGEQLALGRLSTDDAAALLRALGVVDLPRVIARADGCPRFLEELARLDGGAEALPPSIQAAHAAQLDALPAADLAALRLAAIAGRTCWDPLFAALGGAPGMLDRLARQRLLRPMRRSRFEGAAAYEFRSGTLRELVYQQLRGDDLPRLHRATAAWLLARLDVSPEEVADHHERAGDAPRAAAAYAEAARRASRFGDVSATRAHAEHVLRLTGDPDLRWAAFSAQDDVLHLESDAGRRRWGLTQMEALAAGRAPEFALELAWRWCYFLRLSAAADERDRARTEGDGALVLAEALGAPRWSALCSIELAMLHSDHGAAEDARAHAERAVERARATDDGWLRARGAATLAYVLSRCGARGRSLELYATAAEGFARAGDHRREALIRGNVGELMGKAGRLAEAGEQLARALSAAARAGVRPPIGVASHNLGVLRRLAGDLVDARRLQDEAEAVGAEVAHWPLLAAVAVERVYLAAASGAAPSTVEEAARSALERAASTRMPTLEASALAAALLAAPGDLGLRLERARGALAHVDDLEARAELHLAIWVAGGRRDLDERAAREALDRYTAMAAPPEDRDPCRAVLLARCLVGAWPEGDWVRR